MLSDEEKELVEKIQNGNKIGIYELIRTFKREGIENFITVRRKYIDIMINLIEKQSKEIEELEREKAIYYYEWRHLEANVINKIQEYDDKGMTINLANRSAGKTFQQAVHYEVKKVLQSLLDKE